MISLINLCGNNIGSLGCVEIVKLFDNTNCQLRSQFYSASGNGDFRPTKILSSRTKLQKRCRPTSNQDNFYGR